jgi:hypothetical protein
VLLSAGCGRLEFDAVDIGDASVDGAGDGYFDASDGPTAACIDSHQLCDDFEAPTIRSFWTQQDPGTSVDRTMAHRGLASLHVHSDALAVGTTAYTTIQQTDTLALGDRTFHVRAWVRLGSLPSNPMELIDATQPGTDNVDALFVLEDTMAVYSQFADITRVNTAPAPVGTWFCVLWTVTRDPGTAGSISLAGDVPPAQLSNVQTDGVPPIESLGLGIGFAGTQLMVAQPAMDIWLDDVIIDNAPLTCAE